MALDMTTAMLLMNKIRFIFFSFQNEILLDFELGKNIPHMSLYHRDQ